MLGKVKEKKRKRRRWVTDHNMRDESIPPLSSGEICSVPRNHVICLNYNRRVTVPISIYTTSRLQRPLSRVGKSYSAFPSGSIHPLQPVGVEPVARCCITSWESGGRRQDRICFLRGLGHNIFRDSAVETPSRTSSVSIVRKI